MGRSTATASESMSRIEPASSRIGVQDLRVVGVGLEKVRDKLPDPERHQQPSSAPETRPSCVQSVARLRVGYDLARHAGLN